MSGASLIFTPRSLALHLAAHAAPDMARGVHFNIVQNIWNTNYVLWYPFAEADQNIRSRFRLSISQ